MKTSKKFTQGFWIIVILTSAIYTLVLIKEKRMSTRGTDRFIPYIQDLSKDKLQEFMQTLSAENKIPAPCFSLYNESLDICKKDPQSNSCSEKWESLNSCIGTHRRS